MASLKPPSSNQQAAEQPLHLTIRFAASLPDLELDILHPSSTTVVSLKHTIRGRLDPPDSERRLRFIHAGKILPDAAALSTVLKAPLPPPPRDTGGGFGDFASKLGGVRDKSQTHDSDHDHDPADGAGGGKGKSVPGRPLAQRIYVNCSIGASLTTAELEAEAEAAAAPPPPASASLSLSQQQSANPSRAATPLARDGTPVPSTTTAPRGFDRLLSAGFTSAEVNQLRLQFRSLNSSRFTPDTMPSPDSFRRMEDAWIDDNHSGSSNGGGGGADAGGGPTVAPSGGWGDEGGGTNAAGGGGTDTDDTGLAGLTDVMIRGIATGFLWPLGSAGWLTREEGLASQRWRFMVGIGIAFSFLLGVIRTISGPVD